MYGHNSIITYLSEKINQIYIQFVDYLACLNVIKIETSSSVNRNPQGFCNTFTWIYIYSLDCARKLRSKGSLLQLRLTHFELQILHMNINHIALIQKIASV